MNVAKTIQSLQAEIMEKEAEIMENEAKIRHLRSLSKYAKLEAFLYMTGRFDRVQAMGFAYLINDRENRLIIPMTASVDYAVIGQVNKGREIPQNIQDHDFFTGRVYHSPEKLDKGAPLKLAHSPMWDIAAMIRESWKDE